MSTSFAPSVLSDTDLNGFSLSEDSYSFPRPNYAAETDEFGFDPPNKPMYPIKMEQTYTPPQDSLDEFAFDPIKQSTGVPCSRALDLDSEARPLGAVSAVSRHGQLSPPRSNSESSVEKNVEHKSARQRRITKPTLKAEQQQLQEPVSGRKRKNTRKSSITTTGNPEEDEKRKQSLEKNRLAAAKCRVNKKEKTEQLQRDSHEKAVHNAFLKDQVMHMKEEVQQMNALLLQHANCEGCKNPEDVQKHLNNLGNEFFAQHMQPISHDFSHFGGMNMDMHDIEHDHYFSPGGEPSLLNPPLPDFDREPDFDVTTPMHND